MEPAPTAETFLDLAYRAAANLPPPFDRLAEEVVVSVVDLPPKHILDELQIDDPMDLTGLYDGVPLTEKSFADQPGSPDMIWLYRLPILAEHRDRGDVDLADLVAHVLVHELAHHFGWSDDDIAAIDKWWE